MCTNYYDSFVSCENISCGYVLMAKTHLTKKICVTLLSSLLSVPNFFEGPKPSRIGCVTNVYNEEVLLPHWIRHHARICARVIFLNWRSTDRSLEIIRNTAPSGWKVAHTPYGYYEGETMGFFAMQYMSHFKGSFVAIITAAEFLISPNFFETSALEKQCQACAFVIPGVLIVGGDDPFDYNCDLVGRYTVYGLTKRNIGPYLQWDPRKNFAARFLWRGSQRGPYPLFSGHAIEGFSLAEDDENMYNLPGNNQMFVLKYSWTPWPSLLERKIHLADNIEESKKKDQIEVAGHYISLHRNASQANLDRAEQFKESAHINLRLLPDFTETRLSFLQNMSNLHTAYNQFMTDSDPIYFTESPHDNSPHDILS